MLYFRVVQQDEIMLELMNHTPKAINSSFADNDLKIAQNREQLRFFMIRDSHEN